MKLMTKETLILTFIREMENCYSTTEQNKGKYKLKYCLGKIELNAIISHHAITTWEPTVTQKFNLTIDINSFSHFNQNSKTLFLSLNSIKLEENEKKNKLKAEGIMKKSKCKWSWEVSKRHESRSGKINIETTCYMKFN